MEKWAKFVLLVIFFLFGIRTALYGVYHLLHFGETVTSLSINWVLSLVLTFYAPRKTRATASEAFELGFIVVIIFKFVGLVPWASCVGFLGEVAVEHGSAACCLPNMILLWAL